MSQIFCCNFLCFHVIRIFFLGNYLVFHLYKLIEKYDKKGKKQKVKGKMRAGGSKQEEPVQRESETHFVPSLSFSSLSLSEKIFVRLCHGLDWWCLLSSRVSWKWQGKERKRQWERRRERECEEWRRIWKGGSEKQVLILSLSLSIMILSDFLMWAMMLFSITVGENCTMKLHATTERRERK